MGRTRGEKGLFLPLPHHFAERNAPMGANLEAFVEYRCERKCLTEVKIRFNMVRVHGYNE